MMNTEVKIRNEFFISSLFIENMITKYFSEKLKVNDVINADLLEDSDNSFDFEQKIEFLLDSDDFSIIDKSKLSVFREIYKEFSINKFATDIEECFTSEDSNDDFLLILYPQSEYVPREEKLTNACYQLLGEVSELVSDFTNKPEIKLHNKRSLTNRLLHFNSMNLSRMTFLFSFLFLK